VKPSMFGASALAVVLLGAVCVAADESSKPKSSDNAGASSAVQASAGSADAKSDSSAKSDNAAKAQGKAATKAPARTAAAGTRALTKPWKDLTSLSDEQKKQIAEIHRKATQDVKVVEQRERADIMALLSEPQKAELKAMEEQKAVERKTKAAAKPSSARSGANEATDSGTAAKAGATEPKTTKDKGTDKEAAASPAK
jgi:hypothetical protein